MQLALRPAGLGNAFSLISHISLPFFFFFLPPLTPSFPYDILDRHRSAAARSSAQSPGGAGSRAAAGRPQPPRGCIASSRAPLGALRAPLPLGQRTSAPPEGSRGGRGLRGCSLPGLSQLPPPPPRSSPLRELISSDSLHLSGDQYFCQLLLGFLARFLFLINVAQPLPPHLPGSAAFWHRAILAPHRTAPHSRGLRFAPRRLQDGPGGIGGVPSVRFPGMRVPARGLRGGRGPGGLPAAPLPPPRSVLRGRSRSVPSRPAERSCPRPRPAPSRPDGRSAGPHGGAAGAVAAGGRAGGCGGTPASLPRSDPARRRRAPGSAAALRLPRPRPRCAVRGGLRGGSRGGAAVQPQPGGGGGRSGGAGPGFAVAVAVRGAAGARRGGGAGRAPIPPRAAPDRLLRRGAARSLRQRRRQRPRSAVPRSGECPSRRDPKGERSVPAPHPFSPLIPSRLLSSITPAPIPAPSHTPSQPQSLPLSRLSSRLCPSSNVAPIVEESVGAPQPHPGPHPTLILAPSQSLSQLCPNPTPLPSPR